MCWPYARVRKLALIWKLGYSSVPSPNPVPKQTDNDDLEQCHRIHVPRGGEALEAVPDPADNLDHVPARR